MAAPVWDESMEAELVRTIHVIGRVYARLLEPTGTSTAQSTLLFRIAEHRGIAASELAQLTLRDASTITRLIDGLVARGLVERRSDATDRRKQRLHLTPAGRGMVRRLANVFADAAPTLSDGITEADVTALRRLSSKLRRNYERLLDDD